MESIMNHIDKMDDMLQRLEDVIAASKQVPFSSKIHVDKDVVYDIIDGMVGMITDMRKDLPTEVTQAKRIISEEDKRMHDAQGRINMMMNQASADAEVLISEHEITRAATAQATEIIDEAKKSAREYRLSAREYADDVLAKAEDALRASLKEFATGVREVEEHFTGTIDIVYENRQELRNQ